MSFTDKPAKNRDNPFIKRPSCLSAIVITVALFFGTGFVVWDIGSYSADKEQKQLIIKRFKAADPHSQIQITGYYDTSSLTALTSGSSFTLFRCDATSLKALLKKGDFRYQGKRGVDAEADFGAIRWNPLASVRFRSVRSGNVDCYSRDLVTHDSFSGHSFSPVRLYWNAKTGTGCLYICWAEPFLD